MHVRLPIVGPGQHEYSNSLSEQPAVHTRTPCTPAFSCGVSAPLHALPACLPAWLPPLACTAIALCTTAVRNTFDIRCQTQNRGVLNRLQFSEPRAALHFPPPKSGSLLPQNQGSAALHCLPAMSAEHLTHRLAALCPCRSCRRAPLPTSCCPCSTLCPPSAPQPGRCCSTPGCAARWRRHLRQRPSPQVLPAGAAWSGRASSAAMSGAARAAAQPSAAGWCPFCRLPFCVRPSGPAAPWCLKSGESGCVAAAAAGLPPGQRSARPPLPPPDRRRG